MLSFLTKILLLMLRAKHYIIYLVHQHSVQVPVSSKNLNISREIDACRSRQERPILFYFNGNLGSAYEGGRPEAEYVVVRTTSFSCTGANITINSSVISPSTNSLKLYSKLSWQNWMVQLGNRRSQILSMQCSRPSWAQTDSGYHNEVSSHISLMRLYWF